MLALSRSHPWHSEIPMSEILPPIREPKCRAGEMAQPVKSSLYKYEDPQHPCEKPVLPVNQEKPFALTADCEGIVETVMVLKQFGSISLKPLHSRACMHTALLVCPSTLELCVDEIDLAHGPLPVLMQKEDRNGPAHLMLLEWYQVLPKCVWLEFSDVVNQRLQNAIRASLDEAPGGS
ncbi:hypothetical protein STEG23_025360, partial [Scotinomys teguina]